MKTVVFVSFLVSLVRASDPFEFTISSCPDGQFRSLDNGVESCKVCFKPTFRAAYGVATSDTIDAKFQHDRCCRDPEQHVCKVMKAEYEANCPCAADNDHCFNAWDPTGVNVLHLDLSLLDNPDTFQYTDAAGEDQANSTEWVDMGYGIDDEFETYITFMSLIPDGPTVNKTMFIENQEMTIDCTQPDMVDWCASTISTCTEATASIIVSTLYHVGDESDWHFTLAGTILNREGVAGDIELLVVDYAHSMHQYYNVLNENYVTHDQWEKDNNHLRCITDEGGSCSPEETRRRRLLGGGNRRGNCRL